MQIFVKTLTGSHKMLVVEPNERVENVKTQLYEITGIPEEQMRLIYKGMQLEDGRDISYYSIPKDETLHLVLRTKGGSCASEKVSEIVGYIENDHEIVNSPLRHRNLSLRFVRNTNATKVYEQRGGTCYAYAACSAYINTILRIYGSRDPPSFSECYQIACYNGANGGYPYESIRRLENHFHYGILCSKSKYLKIREAINLSVIVSFSTSEDGWRSVASGQLLNHPGGRANSYHAALIEGYDFIKDCLICKNSWGGVTAQPRFDFTPSAAHDCSFTLVYFTLGSIKGLTNLQLNETMDCYCGRLNGSKINCAWMDEKTAIYNSDYICKFRGDKHDQLNHLGYDVNRWISLSLNRENDHSLYYYSNPKSFLHSFFQKFDFYTNYRDYVE